MAKSNSTSPCKSHHNFELVCSLLANNLIPVHKYKSSKTGLTVIVSEVEGPVVNGYFCLATEAHDDDGLPHTLEHLVFLGSEQYPYKGVLDLLANRCLASGTNAWTDTDHTCYTITNAGSEGFLSLLPIYLDHILFPTLTDSAFTTEVYHVDGDGHDSGVVYSEMQGRENSGESRVYLELLRAMYPGDCGYKSETGGIMRNLRESTNNEKVRAFHKQFYRPENLWVIVVGHVKPNEVLETMVQVEEKILSKGPRENFSRPWQTPIPPLLSSVEVNVPYACDEEVSGIVYVGWRGPCVVTDIYSLTACSILLKYLTDTPISLLPKEFVEIPDPYASKVSYSLVENLESLLLVQFENVPTDKLSLVKPQLDTVLKKLVSQKEPFDMDRMATVINRHRLECLSHLENTPHDTIAFILIGYQLYGNTTKDLDQRLNIVRELEKLSGEKQEFWVALLNKYFLKGATVTALGRPSIEEQRRLGEEEEERVKTRISSLGKEALAQKGKALMAALEANNTPPPPKMLTAVPIPNPECIHFHTINSYHTNMSGKTPALFNLDKVPVYTHLDDLNTNFVYMFLLMDSSRVEDSSMRRYLPLLLECLLESGIEREGVIVPYEEVVAQLEADTVATALRIGLDSANRFQCGPYCNTVSLMLQLEPKKYTRGIDWIREILYQTVFSEERVRIIATKIINNVPEVKRQGSSMAKSLMKALIYRNDSNHVMASVMQQYKFLSEVVERLERGDGVAVLRELNSVRAALTDPSHVVLHMAASLEHLATTVSGDLAEPWQFKLLPSTSSITKNKLQVVPDWMFLSGVEDNEVQASGCIVGIGSVDSSYLCLTTACMKEFYHEDLPALLVFLQYLTQLEGPLWKHVRGKGLAYSYNIVPRPQESLLYLTLYKASNVVGAFQETKQVIENKLTEINNWDPTLHVSAKSSLIFQIIQREKCIGDVVAQSLLSYFKRVNHDYNRDLVRKITAVTVEDLKRVGPMYLSQIFDKDLNFNKAAVVCHPSKVDDIADGLGALGLNLAKYYNLEESIMNQ